MVAPPAAAHGPQAQASVVAACAVSGYGTGATWLRRGESSWTRDAPVPCTGRQTLNPQTNREALLSELHMLLLTDGETGVHWRHWALEHHWKLQTRPDGIILHWGCRATMQGPGPLSTWRHHSPMRMQGNHARTWPAFQGSTLFTQTHGNLMAGEEVATKLTERRAKSWVSCVQRKLLCFTFTLQTPT